jgi:ADP-ribosylglycohydrolase
MTNHREAVLGALLGCALGDAIGLPYEGLSRRRGVRLLGQPDRHRFLFGRGMVSDDTQHTWMVGQALSQHPADPEQFARSFARRLRWWLVGVPAGIGFATLRATIRLWLGYSPARSGVFSAGNGPAMRVAVLGAVVDDLTLLHRLVTAATRVTHTDPKADEGAFAVALAAWCARRGIDDAPGYFDQYRSFAEARPSPEFAALMDAVETGLKSGESVEAFATRLKCGRAVSGYVYRTVPIVLFAWLRRRRDFKTLIGDLVRCGGDTDTTAAIAGAIAGTGLGAGGLPKDWIAGLFEWPHTVAFADKLADSIVKATATGESTKPLSYSLFLEAPRNALFFAVVLAHIFRRYLPPY